MRSIPYDAAGGKLFYAAISPTEGEFYKIQSYYQWRSRTLNLMQLSDAAKAPVQRCAREPRSRQPRSVS